MNVLACGSFGVDELAVDGDFKSSGSFGVTSELVVEVFFAKFCIHVLHRLDSVLSVASATTVFDADGDGAGAKLF